MCSVTGLMSACTVLVASPWGGSPVSEMSGFAHPFQSLTQCLEHSKMEDSVENEQMINQ